MKQLYKIILFSSLGLLITTGLALFVFRNQIIGYFHDQAGLSITTDGAPVTLLIRETLDPALLKEKRFTALTNYAVNFDFDNICWRPDTVQSSPALSPEEIATGTELTATTTEKATPLGCRKGNDVPFLVKKK